MGKREFLEKLRTALGGRVSAEVVAENVRYYEDYINIEVRRGRSEEEVLNQLGDPRLIARTIIQTQGGAQRGGRSAGPDGENGDRSGEGGRGYGEDDRRERRFFGLRMPGWLLGAVALAVFAAVLVLILAVVYSVASLLLPVLLIILAVSFVVKLFRDWIS